MGQQPSDKGSWSSILFGYPIITLPHLAGVTPRHHSIRIVNENYEDIDSDEPADLVGITSYTMTAPHVYELADEFRRRGRKVVLGGYHPTAMPQKQNSMLIVSFLVKRKEHGLSLLRPCKKALATILWTEP